AAERRLLVRHAMLAIRVRRAHEGDGLGTRIEARVGQEPVRQWLEAHLPGDLGASAPPGLVRQVQVLEALLRGSRIDLGREGRVELALLRDAREDRRPALLELAKVAEPLVEQAMLGVVQAARCLLAVAGDE